MSGDFAVVKEASPGYALDPATPSVPDGYKKTGAGIIPEKWGAFSILHLCDQIMDYRGRTPKKLGMEWGGGDIPALSAGNVRHGHIDFSAECYYGSDDLYRKWMSKGCTQKDDILFTTEAPLGNVALVPDNQKYILSQRTVLFRTRPEIADSRFVYQYLLSEIFQRILSDYSSGSTAKGIQRKKLEQLDIPLPPLDEQRAIATALSDVDALLEELDRLIAKKRDLKQATMQQLLTGQTRLPGFDGEWKAVRLGDHATFLRNGTNSRAELANDGAVKYLHYGDIHACSSATLNPDNLPYLPDNKTKTLDKLQTGDLIFADASEDMGGVGKSVEIVNLDEEKIVSGLHTVAVRFSKSVLADGFKAYLQNCPSFINQLRRLAAGTKVYATTRRHIASIELALPCVEEQKAIAFIFSAMDTEIEALERRRAKTSAIKQAMMQELLTGRTRLVCNENTDQEAIS